MHSGTVRVMDRLKQGTMEHHARAEGKAFQAAMVQGRITKAQYAAWLGQMLHVHEALEAAIDGARAGTPELRVVGDEHRHSARLKEDLAALGAGAPTPLPATKTLVARIQSLGVADPVALLGMHYVLEGSMNGNTYIARAVRRTLGLSPGTGDRYLDPYGERQRQVWGAWRGSVDGLGLSDQSGDRMLDAARVMFDGIGAMSDEVIA